MSDDSVCKASTAAASQPPAELIPGTKLEHFPNTERKQSWPQSPSQVLLITAEDALCRLMSHNGMWNTLFPVVLCRKWISFVSAVIRFPGCVITCPTKPRFKWLSWAQRHELRMSSFLVGLAAWCHFWGVPVILCNPSVADYTLSVLSCCFDSHTGCTSSNHPILFFKDPYHCTCRHVPLIRDLHNWLCSRKIMQK